MSKEVKEHLQTHNIYTDNSGLSILHVLDKLYGVELKFPAKQYELFNTSYMDSANITIIQELTLLISRISNYLVIENADFYVQKLEGLISKLKQIPLGSKFNSNNTVLQSYINKNVVLEKELLKQLNNYLILDLKSSKSKVLFFDDVQLYLELNSLLLKIFQQILKGNRFLYQIYMQMYANYNTICFSNVDLNNISKPLIYNNTLKNIELLVEAVKIFNNAKFDSLI